MLMSPVLIGAGATFGFGLSTLIDYDRSHQREDRDDTFHEIGYAGMALGATAMLTAVFPHFFQRPIPNLAGKVGQVVGGVFAGEAVINAAQAALYPRLSRQPVPDYPGNEPWRPAPPPHPTHP